MKKINTTPRSEKLDVKKQTIRHLSDDRLKAIAGGGHSGSVSPVASRSFSV
jgi:hypothetical protein